MTGIAGFDGVEFLSRSQNRVRILQTLRTDGPLGQPDLRERLDAPQSTLQRNLRRLEDRKWVRKEGTEYQITSLGELIITNFADLLVIMQLESRLEEFLRWIPLSAFDLDLRHLADAEITLSTPEHPYAPVNKHIDALRSAGTYRALLPRVNRQALEMGLSRMMRDETRGNEVILTRDVVERLRSDPYDEKSFEEMVATGLVDVYMYDGEFPFYLGLVDDTVQIGVEDADGVQRAMLESDAEAVTRWAEELYREYKWNALKVSEDSAIDLSVYAPMKHTEIVWISPTGVEESLLTLVERVTQHADPRNGFRIADIGCGTGTLTVALAEEYPDASVLAVDSARTAADRTAARADAYDNVDVVNGTPESLRAGAVDFLYAVNMVSDTHDPRATMTQLYDVLTEGGRAVVTLPRGGAEDLFVAPARNDDDITFDVTPTGRRIENERFTVEVESNGGMTHLRLDVAVPESGGATSSIRAEQTTIERGAFRNICREVGFTVHDEEELVCDPSGIPHMMDILGYTEAADRWQGMVDDFERAPESVSDRLPRVDFYLLRK